MGPLHSLIGCTAACPVQSCSAAPCRGVVQEEMRLRDALLLLPPDPLATVGMPLMTGLLFA